MKPHIVNHRMTIYQNVNSTSYIRREAIYTIPCCRNSRNFWFLLFSFAALQSYVISEENITQNAFLNEITNHFRARWFDPKFYSSLWTISALAKWGITHHVQIWKLNSEWNLCVQMLYIPWSEFVFGEISIHKKRDINILNIFFLTGAIQIFHVWQVFFRKGTQNSPGHVFSFNLLNQAPYKAYSCSALRIQGWQQSFKNSQNESILYWIIRSLINSQLIIWFA